MTAFSSAAHTLPAFAAHSVVYRGHLDAYQTPRSLSSAARLAPVPSTRLIANSRPPAPEASPPSRTRTTALVTMSAPFNSPPTADEVSQAASISVFDAAGNEVPLGTLFQNEKGGKAVVIFIRHFLCGLCRSRWFPLDRALAS